MDNSLAGEVAAIANDHRSGASALLRRATFASRAPKGDPSTKVA